MKLSHSALDLYKTCPRAYQIKYIERYAEKYLSSALWFGSGIGDTLSLICLDKKQNLTDEEKTIMGTDPYEFFDKHISTGILNGREIQLINSNEVVYFRGDYDETILHPEDHEIIEKYRKDNGFEEFHTFEALYNDLKSGRLDDAEKSFINLMFWLSVRRRGHLIIKEYIDKVYPLIVEVEEIEGEISIQNGEGDEIRGFLDMLCTMEIDGEVKRVIVDHKTSSSKYSKNKIQESQQLSLYDYDREVGFVGYIVAIKKVKTPKRGPRKGETHTEIQMMFETIPEETQEGFIADADGILNAIKCGEFPKTENENQCKFMFGRSCSFWKACKENDYSDLYKKPERK